MNEFSIDDIETIYLYADNIQSKKLAKVLMDQGYPVRGIIDIKFSLRGSMMINNCQIELNNADFFDTLREKEKVLVIICLNNGFIHSAVATELFNKGIKNIIYLPLKMQNIPINIQNRMCQIYSEVMDYGLDSSIKIPYTNEYVSSNYNEINFRLIEKNSNYISFLCHKDLLYTQVFDALIENIFNPNNVGAYKIFCDQQIENFEPYILLFKYLSGNQNVDIDKYLSFFRNNSAEKEKLLKDRSELFELYEYNLKYNFSFFLNSPANCCYDGKKIRVKDGYHRLLYLIYKGYDLLPIKIPQKDFVLLSERFKIKKD